MPRRFSSKTHCRQLRNLAVKSTPAMESCVRWRTRPTRSDDCRHHHAQLRFLRRQGEARSVGTELRSLQLLAGIHDRGCLAGFCPARTACMGPPQRCGGCLGRPLCGVCRGFLRLRHAREHDPGKFRSGVGLCGVSSCLADRFGRLPLRYRRRHWPVRDHEDLRGQPLRRSSAPGSPDRFFVRGFH